MRILEFIAALGLLVLALPVLLILLLAVRLSSPGPALFRQERVGLEKRPFVLLKLRTMRTGTKQAGTHEVGADAVTAVGRFLRKSKLDELPQLVNVLRGEMSFVGPRPCLPVQEQLVEERDRRGVFSVRPGITGLAQVRGIDMSDPIRLAEVDADYVARRSPSLNLAILWRTLTGQGFEDRVRPDDA